MEIYQVRFRNQDQQDNLIQCYKTELMRDIINRYGTESGLPIRDYDFFYNDKIINMDQTFGQLNDKDKAVLVIVKLKETKESENTKNSEIGVFNRQNEIDSEISLKINIEEGDINKNIYFLDNTTNGYYEKKTGFVNHQHDNLSELNENNTILTINGKTVCYKKLFVPTKKGIYSIKLSFKIKLSNCAYMFCECKNIIDIDFSKFDTENVKDMYYMLHGCSGLKSLNLSSFNTVNVECMQNMFSFCSSLIKLNLSSFDTRNVSDMDAMFFGCSSLIKLNLSSFNTQKVMDMHNMFDGCFSLIKLNLSSFSTENVMDMHGMFHSCSSLIILNLSSFSTENVRSMCCMFSDCSSLVTLNLSSFNTANANTFLMFDECINLLSCGSSDVKIVAAFENNY